MYLQNASTCTRDLIKTNEVATQTEYVDLDVDSKKEEVDSDATIDYYQVSESAAESSSGSYTDIYEDDPTYDGPVYHSQPCMSGIHGASYTPTRRVYIA